MSRKSRRRKVRNRRPASAPAQKHAEFYDPAAQATIMASFTGTAQDGYSNAAAFLGSDSPLISAGTFVPSGLSSNIPLLTTTYRECWLATRIIDTPADDMTRSWYSLTGNFTPDDLADLRRLEAQHSVKQELADAIRWARLYGGILALMVIDGEGDRLDEPLDLGLLPPDCFKGLLVLDHSVGISPSLEKETDLSDPDYGLPKYYTINVDDGEVGTLTIHHSRLLRFVGRPLPRAGEISQNYWGASELEHIWDELQKRSATSANIAQLVFQANITTLKMSDFGDRLALSNDVARQGLQNLISEENRFRTSFGLQLLSKGDSLENHTYTFAGLNDIYESFMMDIAGAAEIPATKLFGRSPQGFQSTGEAELRNYYEMIAALQERYLRPALERLLPVMAISCFGYLPEDLDFVFNPLATVTAEEAEDLAGKLSDRVEKLYSAGLLTWEEARSELKTVGEKYAAYSGIDPDAKAPVQGTSHELMKEPSDPFA